jgi:Cys-rich repeat protein
MGTACSDGGGKVCDGSGHCVECNGSGDCTAPATCQGGMCVPPVNQQNGATCTAPNQCQSGFCADGVCCVVACTGTCDQCNLPGTVGQCFSVPGGSDNPDHPCAGGVCTGPPANACVQCVSNTNCAAGTVCDTMGDGQEGTCVACNVNGDCQGGACDAHLCDAGNWLSPNDAGPMVQAPACGGSLVDVANTACAMKYAGSHWCTANDANGTGTYHTAACAADDFQFNGGVTCAGNEWSTDIGQNCVGGVVQPVVQPYFAVGAVHEVDCCN